MARKIRKKTKSKSGKAAIKVVRKVRLPQKLALELHTLAHGGDLTEAKRHLKMLRPELSAEVIHEVAFRCADPGGTGGIETGVDPKIGNYADVAVTK
jgi:hypothetical protein